MAKQRIQKVLAESGVASRRAVEEMILEGRILVNGELVASLPCFVEPKDEIIIDNITVRKKPSIKRYFLLNKPRNVVCTQSDPDGRRRAMDLLPPMKERLYCVGRLDADSMGIILMTNDGELTQKLTHPSYGVPKRYQVVIRGHLTPEAVDKFKNGIYIDGKRTLPAQLKVIAKTRDGCVIEVTLTEGRNREIRRMLLRMGYKVRRLMRVAIGPITDRGLKTGGYRELTEDEVLLLQDSCSEPAPRPKRKRRSRRQEIESDRPWHANVAKSTPKPTDEVEPKEIIATESTLGAGEAPSRRRVISSDGSTSRRGAGVEPQEDAPREEAPRRTGGGRGRPAGRPGRPSGGRPSSGGSKSSGRPSRPSSGGSKSSGGRSSRGKPSGGRPSGKSGGRPGGKSGGRPSGGAKGGKGQGRRK
jgi:23S rRNA pseudouridine2605 synthase